ncbi:MAG TPA: regulatory iron-sulfur-containing complex subunit RicT [Bacteroidia bacterium]|nr:hypothetical protein [Sphingobacteriales bacterium]HPD63939.1 regulatory iron-sulfur-containing complex subunit RicT [Bacteroidia bacterium]HRS57700.1 regulatory iron-sulfur-containing complex subunit RicT [Bacteroidia bacterium]HRU67085.1 regulatory iron-sulfur-containing complex subunit RicT [Bacteroidia bacterium]
MTSNKTLQRWMVSREECKYCCNKLSTFDWQEELKFTNNQYIPEFVEVRFKSTKKLICKNINKYRIHTGDILVVEFPTGNDVGIVSLASPLVYRQIKKKNIDIEHYEFPKILRHAGEKDKQIWQENINKEYEVLLKARKIAADLKLQMKLDDIEIQSDGKKTTFYYTAEGRVDFRELIKVYAREFKTKIEMRQIGIRQESGRVGGIGDCGRELCCSSWLTEFNSVPTIAAKQQNLYLNPSKLSGQCGRLKCCLNYELDAYYEIYEKFPSENTVLKTKNGNAVVFKLDILREIMYFTYEDSREVEVVPVHINQVKQIMEMNKKNIYPDLAEYKAETSKKNNDSEFDLKDEYF